MFSKYQLVFGKYHLVFRENLLGFRKTAEGKQRLAGCVGPVSYRFVCSYSSLGIHSLLLSLTKLNTFPLGKVSLAWISCRLRPSPLVWISGADFMVCCVKNGDPFWVVWGFCSASTLFSQWTCSLLFRHQHALCFDAEVLWDWKPWLFVFCLHPRAAPEFPSAQDAGFGGPADHAARELPGVLHARHAVYHGRVAHGAWLLRPGWHELGWYLLWWGSRQVSGLSPFGV